MKNSKEDCNNLQVMCQDLENYGTQTRQTIMDYRYRIWDCICSCWEVKKECKETLLYFMNKCWIILEIR